jgi:rare lipoprotein A
MNERQSDYYIGWFILFVALLFIGISEVNHGRELTALRAGQAEVSAGIAVVGQGFEDLGRRIDNLAEALGQPAVERGLASWYGDESGEIMANGKRFDKRAMTAAHKKIPFGTLCLVENLLNGRRALVTIADRGPYYGARILDLSEASAEKLGMIEAGVIPVRIHLITRAIPIARPGTGD